MSISFVIMLSKLDYKVVFELYNVKLYLHNDWLA